MPRQNIYFIGPAAGALATEEETFGIPENIQSIFATAPRTAEFAEKLAEKIAEKKTSSVPITPNIKRSFVEGPRRNLSLTVQPEKESYIPGQLDDLYLSSMIQKILGGFDLPKSCEIRLLFRCKDKSCLVLDVEVGANAQSLTDLVSELQSDPDIVRLLLAFLGQAERTLRIEVQVVTDPDGTIDRQQSVFRIEAE